MKSNININLISSIILTFILVQPIFSAPAEVAVIDEDDADLLYANAGNKGPGVWNAGIGLVKVNFPEDNDSTVNFLTAEVEGGAGLMGRAGAFDVTKRYSNGVSMNYALSVDTGVVFNRGVEVKYLGIGGKIGADGIEGCFILCFGFNWW